MKTVTVVYSAEERPREALERSLIGELGPAWVDGQDALTIYVADREADFAGPSPFPLWGPVPVAVIDAWGEPLPVEPLLERGFLVHQWESDPSVPTEYGDNEHAAPRDWPDGARSPGPVLISLLERPRRFTVEEWLKRWHGVMSPVSAEIQPRTRYVRNHFLAALTPDPPPWEGLVAEAWPSRRHLRDPWLFYGASTAWELVRNQVRILRAVQHCFHVWRIHTVVMGEYILKSPSA